VLEANRQVGSLDHFTVDRPIEVTWTDLRGTDHRFVPPGKIGVDRPVGKATVRSGRTERNICALALVEPPGP